MKTIFCFSLLVLVLALPATLFGFEVLTDEQMANVTAGSYDTSAESQEALARIPFKYRFGKGEVEGEVIFLPTTSLDQLAQLQLMDNAQSNLSSLVNINAVNSPVQVLMNLSVNVNSTIGNLSQWNHQISW